jgi:2-polyprenyl-3-methyl-5-hydroxy-6-metoxy-1,4-benzoquinol methylase
MSEACQLGQGLVMVTRNAARTEKGVVIGNVDDKYGTRNPIARRLMQGFTDGLDALIERTGMVDVHEIGCGEGHLSARLAQRGFRVRACDFSEAIIAEAKSLHGHLPIDFTIKSIYDLSPETDRAPVIICCEVLEHLETPERALQRLREVTGDWCILSVPREPIWRLLNMMRMKYLGDLGNTPGHLQHWSQSSFLRFVATQFEIVEVRSPLPWTQVLCRPKPR